MSQIEELMKRALKAPTGSDRKDLALFAKIRKKASVEDVPLLLDTMRSEQANFWVREMLAEPACALGGPKALPPLLEAFRMNEEERHDNDSFAVHLIDMVEEQPAESAAALKAVVEQGDEELTPIAVWLLEYCS